MTINIQRRWAVAFAAVAAVALAGTLVDQGVPGNYGPWKVTSVASSASVSTPTATTTVLAAQGNGCTTAGDADCTTIYASTEWITYSNITITIRNSGANAITDVLVEWSPDGTNFEVWDNTTFAALAAGAIDSLAIAGNSRRYLRIEARSASGATAVVNITASTL